MKEDEVISPEELAMENAVLKMELLARELICAAMLQKLGGKVTLSKSDLKDLQFLIGNADYIINTNDSFAMSRTKIGNDSVTYELIIKKVDSGKVM